jgi:VanZ family protein
MPVQDNPRLSWALTTLLAMTIIGLTLSPPMTLPLPDTGLLQVDKLYHIAAFAALMLPAAILNPRSLRWVLPAGLALGLAIELIQPQVGRDASVFDFLADAIGLALGTAMGLSLRRFRTRSAA